MKRVVGLLGLVIGLLGGGCVVAPAPYPSAGVSDGGTGNIHILTTDTAIIPTIAGIIRTIATATFIAITAIGIENNSLDSSYGLRRQSAARRRFE